ncbi:MAG TPA: adenylate/guanylate cyclase domain-containing protein [Flavobacteriales bacterium]|nr:adenylate/guanylate cyclase domain-containing protein [Flavobacteriales bacterium]
MNAITRYKLRKLLKYALVAGLVALVLTLFSGTGMSVLVFSAWLLLGLWTGVLEEYFFGRRFRALAVPLQFLGKVLLLNLFTLVLIGIAWFWNSERFRLMPGENTEFVEQIFSTLHFYRLVLRVVVVTSIAILVVQVEEWMGRRTFMGFLLGMYERPKAEERVVLTMDLVSSTEIAERLGVLRYYRFLNKVYSLMTDAVLRNEADIHKYVGDEVIFTWPMRVGVRQLNSIDLFFDIQARLEEHRNDLLREYGIMPQFRASLHGGRVISAQVGHIKRTVDLSGDVMNSVSRMLGLAKAMKVDFLVSAELLARMPDVTERFEIGPQHIVPVKGKRREVRVHEAKRKSLAP